jgi:hypothetical protein
MGASRLRQSVPEKAVLAGRLTDSPPSRLTFDERQALRAEIDRARRAKLTEVDREEAEQLLAMFADERPPA